MITFPAVLSQRHNYTKNKLFVETWRRRIRQKQRKWQKQIRSNGSLTTAWLCFIFIRLTPVLKNHFATDSIHISFFLHARICLALKSVVTFTPYSHRFARAEHIALLCVKTKKRIQASKYLQHFFSTASRVRSSTPKFLVWSALWPPAF